MITHPNGILIQLSIGQSIESTLVYIVIENCQQFVNHIQHLKARGPRPPAVPPADQRPYMVTECDEEISNPCSQGPGEFFDKEAQEAAGEGKGVEECEEHHDERENEE